MTPRVMMQYRMRAEAAWLLCWLAARMDEKHFYRVQADVDYCVNTTDREGLNRVLNQMEVAKEFFDMGLCAQNNDQVPDHWLADSERMLLGR